jgi:MoaA/NifB/PqqE/SkfB family radical SAM enzyme
MADAMRKIQLLRGVLHGEKAYTGPFFIDLDITRRCNRNCLGCQYHSPEMEATSMDDRGGLDMPFDLVQRLCRELPRMGTGEVIIIGEGEPFLHPRLFDIIAAFKGSGCRVQLFTNGTLIGRDEARRLQESGLDVLKVSLWASSPGEYAVYHGGGDPEGFRDVLNGIREAVGSKSGRGAGAPEICLARVVNARNSGSLESWIDLAWELGCDSVNFAFLRHWRGKFAGEAVGERQMGAVRAQFSLLKKRLESLGLKHNIDGLLFRCRLGENPWHRLPCYAGWFHSRIQVDGVVIPCSTGLLPMGSLHEESFHDVWNGNRYRSFRKRASTLSGLASLSPLCDCGWCNFAGENCRVNRLLRWAAPWRG